MASALVQMTVNEIPLDRVNVFVNLPHGNTRYPAGCCNSNLSPPSTLNSQISLPIGLIKGACE